MPRITATFGLVNPPLINPVLLTPPLIPKESRNSGNFSKNSGNSRNPIGNSKNMDILQIIPGIPGIYTNTDAR